MNVIPPVAGTTLIRYADLFRLTMQSGTYYFATTPASISVRLDPLSNVYTTFSGLGQLVKANGAQRDVKSTANETTITMVGIDTTMLGVVLDSKIKGSKIELWHAFFDSENQLLSTGSIGWINNSSTTITWTNSGSATIGWTSSAGITGVYKYFNGYINSFSIDEQWMEEIRAYVGTITISAASFQLILQNRTAGRFTNDNSWQSFNTGDTSMNRVAFISSINYQFGKTT